MISLRQRLKAERKRADAAQTKLVKAIGLAEENAADALFLREAVKVHLTMLKALVSAPKPITEGVAVEIIALVDATAESMGVTLDA